MKNILYIHTHDTGRIISPYGFKTPTPNLEQFAKESVLFRKMFCVGPTCSPSRAGLLTGTYPHQNGMLGLAQRGFELDYPKHLVQFLGKNGFRTVLCGIQHESGWYLDKGEAAQIIGYKEEITTDSTGIPEEKLIYWDQANAEEVCKWLNQYQGEQPFFLSYGMFATHRKFPAVTEEDILPDYVAVPYPVPDTEETRRDYAGYLAGVKSVDLCFGKVIEALKANNLWENTIVIFTTDHGIANPFSKCTLFDGGIGVAFMLYAHDLKATGKAVDALASQIDVFPTLCDLLELEKPEYLEGVSLLPLLNEEEKKVREDVFAEINFHTSYEPVRCIRTERYKYIRYYDPEYLRINQSNIDESPTKDYYLKYGLGSCIKEEEALYDLVFDPLEKNNIIHEFRYKSVLEDLRKKLQDFQVKTEDPLLQGPIPIKPEWKVNKKECRIASSKDANDYVSLGRKKI